MGRRIGKRARARSLCRRRATGPAALLWAQGFGKSGSAVCWWKDGAASIEEVEGRRDQVSTQTRERCGINFKKQQEKKQINKHKKAVKRKKKQRLQGPFANYQHLHLLIRSNEHILNSLFSPNMNISFSLTCYMCVDSFQWSHHSLFFPKCAPACVYVNIKCKTTRESL